MKVFIILILSVMYCVSALAQSLIKPDHKVVNMGVKVGLRALQSDISSIDMDEVRLEDIHLKHNVGYMAGFLIRVNVDRFFIQPSAFWNYSSGDIRFDVIRPASEQTNESAVEFPQSMTMQIKSFEVPVVVGYHLIKQHPYVFSLMGGVKLKYNYDIQFTANGPHTSFSYRGDTSPYHWAAYTAMEVLIGKLTFDIGYECGLNRLHSDFDPFSYHSGGREKASAMRISKYLNGLSMSVGILF